MNGKQPQCSTENRVARCWFHKTIWIRWNWWESHTIDNTCTMLKIAHLHLHVSSQDDRQSLQDPHTIYTNYLLKDKNIAPLIFTERIIFRRNLYFPWWIWFGWGNFIHDWVEVVSSLSTSRLTWKNEKRTLGEGFFLSKINRWTILLTSIISLKNISNNIFFQTCIFHRRLGLGFGSFGWISQDMLFFSW